MKSDQAKYFFNAALFFLVGIISFIRKEPLEAVISITFCGIFFSLGLTLREPDNELLPGNLN